jgi:SAM-dependent methyltransferase
VGEDVLAAVARYYGDKVGEHGATPRGVDWSSAESQNVRFEQLLQIAPVQEPFTLLDYGCGYGALLDVLHDLVPGGAGDYVGFDIAPEMIARAQALHPSARFVSDDALLPRVDYVVSSGIFNVKLEADPVAWRDHVYGTLDRIDELAGRGFAFNMLTSYSDPPLMRPDLYYADPGEIFDRCKRHYSRHVTLLHDYGLWEFTILVRREPRT